MDNESERGGEVIRAHREAAADAILAEGGCNEADVRKMRAGMRDGDSLVQAFARHRSTNATTGWRSDMQEAPLDQYVLIYVGRAPWHDNQSDPKFDVAKRIKKNDALGGHFEWQTFGSSCHPNYHVTAWCELPPPPTIAPAGGDEG